MICQFYYLIFIYCLTNFLVEINEKFPSLITNKTDHDDILDDCVLITPHTDYRDQYMIKCINNFTKYNQTNFDEEIIYFTIEGNVNKLSDAYHLKIQSCECEC